MIKSVKICLIATLVVDAIAVITAFVLGFVFGYTNETTFKMIAWVIMGLGLFNVTFITAEEYAIKKYQSKKFTLIMHAAYAVLACAVYYVLKYAGNYSTFWYLYLLSLVLGTIIIVVVFTVLNFKIKDKKPTVKFNNAKRG